MAEQKQEFLKIMPSFVESLIPRNVDEILRVNLRNYRDTEKHTSNDLA